MKGGDAFALNPLFQQMKGSVVGLYQAIQNKVRNPEPSSEGKSGTYLLWFIIIATLVLISLLGWYFSVKNRLETPDNVRTHAYDYLQSADKVGSYSTRVGQRKSLVDYLSTLKAGGVPASHMALTNFYFSTVNAAGLFYPQADGVVSPDAAKLAVQAGARAFIFDIWPDLRSGADFMPVLHVVESPSQWRRITLNSMPFNTVLNTIIGTVFGSGFNPAIRGGSSDVVILYLRFRGTPRPATFQGAAAALRDAMEQYRLDSSFYACRGQNRLFRTPITEFFSKVIVTSNVRAEGTLLEEYINSVQKGPVPDTAEWSPRSVTNLTLAMEQENKPLIQQTLTFSAPLPEEKEAMTNSWDWKKAQALGIHSAGLNFFEPSDQLTEYLAPDMFGVYSYKMKPESLRFTIQMIARPGEPPDPGYGSGPTSGTAKTPDPIRGI